MASYKKIIFSLIVIVFTALGFFNSKPALAIPTEVIASQPSLMERIWDRIEKAYDKVQGIVGADLANRTLESYLNSFAYDVATELATGGAGGNPQFRTLSIKDHLQQAQDRALGNFLGELTEKSFADLGINLCDPSLELKLSLTLSLVDEQRPPVDSTHYGNRCNWTNIKKQWENFGDNVMDDLVKFQLDTRRSGITSTMDFYKSFSEEESDLGTYLKLQTELNNREQAVLLAQDISASECQGYMDKATTITKQVKTHCAQILNMTEADWDSSVQASITKREMAKEAATTRKLSEILRDAGNRFVDTFTSKLMKHWLQDGMWSLFGGEDSKTYEVYREGIMTMLRGGGDIYQPRNQDIFQDFKTISIKSLESYEYINDLAICPDDFRQPDNCAMSTSFLQAVNNRLTVNEAIEQGIISGSLPFIGPTDVANSDVTKCYRDGLCYNNLVKLRKYNIIPVGWEMAAQRGPVTLQEAIDCFEDPPESQCRFGVSEQYNVDGVAHNPFYHLVDGDWVLKSPQALCDAHVYSSVLESSASSDRQQYCADPKICLREDDDGNCLEGQYSYCTRSENIWRFDGNVCEDGDIYSGCLTFENADIGSDSYIEGTLEYCTYDQAGCKRYSQEQDNLGNWVLDDIADDDNDLFLNGSANDCTDDVAGCSEYIVMAADTGANLIANGDFEGGTYINSYDVEVPRGFTAVRNGGGVPNFSIVPDEGTNSSVAVLPRINDGHLCINNVPLVPDTNYTVSVDVKINDADPGDASGRIMVAGCRDENGYYGGVSSPDGSMVPVNDVDPDLPADEANLTVHPSNFSTDTYTRITGTFNSGNSTSCGAICIGADYGTAAHFFDNFKMEVVSKPSIRSVYRDYGAGATIYMDADAVMCVAEEVGCQGYKPINGDPMVPAVIRQDDLCPAECVGYATFTEQPDIFDILEDPAGDPPVGYYNLIADSARSCPDQEIGCEEFTNLDAVAEGGEGREYYTYLRQCVPADLGSSYYTWEGSDVAGYQIKTWNILVSGEGNPASPNPNAPCTNIEPGESECVDTDFNVATCNREDMANDPNCREFFNSAGESFLVYQDRVIFADNNCHDYRRTETGTVFRAIPDLSMSCKATNNGCRSYYGNAANNVRQVFVDNFENGSYAPWEEIDGGSIDLSNESLANNGHSIKIEKNSELTTVWRDVSGLMQNNKEYELSWWMKNEGFLDRVRVLLYAEDLSGDPIVSTVDCGGTETTVQSLMMHDCMDVNLFNIEPGSWHEYTISNFVNILGSDVDMDSLRLIVYFNGNLGNIFLDNIMFREVTESLSLVRNSWVTPSNCDTPYNGYHLGCQSYVDLNGSLFNLKSFDSLCREDAIGCMPVIDTHNSSNPFEEAFNAYCEDGTGASRPEYYSQSRCEGVGYTWITDYSEIIVPDDNIDYLVPDPSKYCQEQYKGCMALGLPDRDDETVFSTVYKINDPDQYSRILCDSEALGCDTFESNKGNYYFKDPGSNTCTYQENAEIDGNLLSGWFKTSSLSEDELVGCSDTDGVFQSTDLEFLGDYCTWPFDNQVDCENNRGVWEDGICHNVFYYTEFDCENNGGLWLNYEVAALCPSAKNMCTTFRDPSDPKGCDPNIGDPTITGYCTNPIHDNELDCDNGTCTDATGLRLPYLSAATCPEIWNPAGNWTSRCTDYYYYDDDLIDESSCAGTVDKADGCALFYEANNWNGEHSDIVNLYDSNRTYNIIASENKGTSPFTCDPSIDPSCNLDANKLIKVNKDRQCAEWLACKSSSAVLDPETNDYKIICDELDSCIEYKYNSDSNTTKCKTWATFDDDVEALTFDVYQSRTSGPRDFLQWDDKEYTGYAIPNYISTTNLEVYDFGDSDVSRPRLVYDATDSIDYRRNRAYHSSCVDTAALPDTFSTTGFDGQPCTAIVNDEVDGDGEYKYYFSGECREGICWVAPEVGTIATTSFGIETRGYAVANAPFPASILSEEKVRDTKYHQANLCNSDPENPANINGCEQVYKRATYGVGGDAIYYPDNTAVPPTMCTSGQLKVGNCNINSDCDTSAGSGDGICSDLKEIATFRNWPGICMEYDKGTDLINDIGTTYFCNQWYPVDKISGTGSLYDNYVAAGYYEPSGSDALFCSVSEPFELNEDRIYCGNFNNVHNCLQLIRVPAGARINLDAAGDLSLLRKDFLDSNDYRWYSRDDLFLADVNNHFGMGPCTEDGTDCNASDRDNPDRGWAPVGVDRLERRDRNEDQPWFSRDLDFIGPLRDDGTFDIDTHSLAEIERIFDTTYDIALDIEVYFYDERVNSTADYNKYARVEAPGGYNARWGPECDLDAEPEYWNCGEYYDSTNPYSGHADREDSPEGEYHQAYSRGTLGEGASGSVYDCTGGCGAGKSKVCRDVYCNPLNYNYYVKAEVSEGPMVCTDYNCSSGLGITGQTRGLECLQEAAGAYETFIASNGMDDPTFIMDDCDSAANPDICRFVYCVEHNVDLSGHDADGIFVEDWRDPSDYGTYLEETEAAVPPVVYCGDFGGNATQQIDVPLDDGSSCTFNNVAGLTGCFTYLYDFSDEISIFDESRQPIGCSLTGDIDENNIDSGSGFSGPYTYRTVHLKSTIPVDSPVLVQAFGETAEDGTVLTEGCLKYLDQGSGYYGNSANAGCFQSSSILDESRITGSAWFFDDIEESTLFYPYETQGVDCTDGGTNYMSCYQQCGTIAHLDAEGDQSWIRTDIWWRNSQAPDYPRIIVRRTDSGRWESYYYDNTNTYGLHGDVHYAYVGDDMDSGIELAEQHFGAAMGLFDGTDIVSTRVPLETTPYPTDFSAATFFAYEDGGDPAVVWDNAARGLSNLFARTYNLVWDRDSQTYLPDGYRNIEGYGNNSNPFAGSDESPWIFKVCNGNICPTTGGEVEQGITVNDNNSGELQGQGGSLFVNVKFYYFAHPDHMPVTSVDVNWGDGVSTVYSLNPGKYKNSIPDCNPENDIPGQIGRQQGFGGLERACREGYKVFYHDYQYDLDEIGVSHPCGIGGSPDYDDASCFRPTIRITDRWGYVTEETYDGWIVIRED